MIAKWTHVADAVISLVVIMKMDSLFGSVTFFFYKLTFVCKF